MRILLLNPSWTHERRKKGQVYDQRFPPLILCNMAALLREAGHQVVLLDANLERWAPQRVAREALGFDQVFVTSSTITRWICPDIDTTVFDKTCQAIRGLGIPTVILGAHGSALPEEMLRRTGADACIVGEPEWTALELADRWPEREVQGVAHIDEDGAFHPATRRPPGDLRSLPVPAFDLLRPGGYRYEILGPDLGMFELARGCPHHCTFCGRSMHGNVIRSKTPAQLEGEIRAAQRSLGIRSAYFIDLELTLQRDRVLELCERIRGLPGELAWCCQTRADAVDAELLRHMRQAGCRLIHFGVESGSQDVLDRIGKGIRLDRLERGVALTREAGMDTACFFMFGFPGETDRDMRATSHFAQKLDPDYASFHVAVPFPGTVLHRAFDPAPPEPFPTHFHQEHDGAKLDLVRRKATAAFYLRPRTVLRRLRRGDLRSAPSQLGVFLWYLR